MKRERLYIFFLRSERIIALNFVYINSTTYMHYFLPNGARTIDKSHKRTWTPRRIVAICGTVSPWEWKKNIYSTTTITTHSNSAMFIHAWSPLWLYRETSKDRTNIATRGRNVLKGFFQSLQVELYLVIRFVSISFFLMGGKVKILRGTK